MLERKKKIKKHGYADLLKYIHMMESGKSVHSIHNEYGINAVQLQVLWDKYQKYGASGLHKSPNIKSDFVLRKLIVFDIEENHLTLRAASFKYGVSSQRIAVWLSMPRKGNCLDNAMMENFFGLMKNELLYVNKYENIKAFENDLKKYILWYNNKRVKLRLKGMSPIQYWTQYYRDLNV